ncbi:MAG: T9SS type A sorting domain-containing protein [Bacteroidales bacterium]|nr:T9SS type A sorting domain-containing protein [Bacteroidales bacterium]MCF8344893.1 T9SS type A sorting domain-containing protein [Bacteroidales bacterium]MCF8350430.1 T9SS type A sorting domain-containing protein [Bacteroidales bacterium]MCF8377681.1 T9SS type A sorting domain-containing protein [Bacteroidales bacterium]MCF8401957.1 T9SS type A sorting domain-containing protein [Bacteroidales bacterium]
MRSLSKLALFLVFTMIFGTSFSQGVGIGQWRDHLPYGKTIAVAVVDEKVYCATPYSLFYYNKSDNSVERLNKINGLSDFGISDMAYNQSKNTLLIAYSNANIDLIKSGEIVNIPDIKRANLLGDKTINSIFFLDDYAYLSCGFGIVVLDVVKEEIKDTYLIGPEGSQINVLDFAMNDTSFFAATEEGVYYADKSSPNLSNYAEWNLYENTPAPDEMHNKIFVYEGNLFLNIVYDVNNEPDTLYVFDGNSWSVFNTQVHDLYNINESEDFLIISDWKKIYLYDNQLQLRHTIDVPFIAGELNYFDVLPAEATIDNEDLIWVADRRGGLVKVTEWGAYATPYKLEGPPSINVFQITNAGEDIWVAPGGRTSVWAPVFNGEGLFVFSDEDWLNYNRFNKPSLEGLHDFIKVAVDPFNPDHVYAAAFRNDTGIVEFLDGEVVNLYDDENSSLQFWPAAKAIAVAGMDFDRDGNLWASVSGASDILSVRINDGSPDGEWYAFNLGSSLSGIDVGDLLVDSYDQKWILKRKTIESPYFIIVFNDNNTIDDPSDDMVKGLTKNAGSGNIPGNKMFSMAVDQDGEVWIGTDNGVAVVYSPENIFTGGNYDAQRIIIPRNDGSGLGDILLENEVITAITVDGDNNKWIGTDNAGVFLISPNGMEEIYHFTEENSPLFSNMISDIAINENGEVFIGTSKGIISFRSEAAPPNPTLNDVYAYPNPVREGYTGTIGIKGLVKDADVKITDISGNLVYETRSFGGQAVWNGYSLDGKKAQTGVYLVFISNDDGSETMATKILVIN